MRIINKKVVKMTELTLTSHYIKEGILQKQFQNLPELPFVYEIGDYVALKSLATSKGKEDNERPGFKRSLGKIFLKLILTYFTFSGVRRRSTSGLKGSTEI